MEIPVLSYEIHENLASCRDFFQKLKLFAVACGWTLKREELLKQWASIGGGQYGFITGIQDYMELFSVGHGSQYLNFRIYLGNESATDAQNFWVRGHRYDTYKTNSSTHPVDTNATEDAWNRGSDNSGYHSIKKANIPAVWLFGNDKFICWVMQCSVDYFVSGYFGSPNLFSSSENYLATASRSSATSSNTWIGLNLDSVFDSGLIAGTLVNNITTTGLNHIRHGFSINDGNTISNDSFYPMSHLVKKNAVSSIRPIAPHIFYAKNPDLTRWYCPGNLWIGRIVFAGFTPGQKVEYGSEQYLVFPVKKLSDYYGNAFRVA